MPWTCKHCNTGIELTDDDLTCPDCSEAKTAWTMVKEQTRAFIISRRKVEYMRGDGYQAVAEGHPSHDPASAIPTEQGYALPKTQLKEIADKGLLPPSVYVLHVRLFPGDFKDLTVTLSILFDEDEVADREFPKENTAGTLNPEGYVDAKFVLVYGEEQLEIEVPGMQVIDITEDTEDGFAPAIEAAALKRKPKNLPITLLPPWFQITLLGPPLVGWRYEVAIDGAVHEGVLDESGRVHISDVGAGPGTIRVLQPVEEAQAVEEGPGAFIGDFMEHEVEDEDAPEPQAFTFSA